MDKKKEKDLIKVAKIALGTTGEWTEVMTATFLWVQGIYTGWEFRHRGPTLGELHENLKQYEKITKKYLREMKSLSGVDLRSRETIEADLQRLKKTNAFIADIFAKPSDLREDDPWYRYSVPDYKKKGPPINRKLRSYIYFMAAWYREFIMKVPRYGTFSIFTKFVGDCLAMLDEQYIDNPPYKTIQNTLVELRKLFPNGLSLTTFWE